MENKRLSSRRRVSVPHKVLPSKRTHADVSPDVESDVEFNPANPPPKSTKARKTQPALPSVPVSDIIHTPKTKTKSPTAPDPKKPNPHILDTSHSPFTRQWWREVSKHDQFWVQFKKCIPATTLKKRLGLAINTNVEKAIGNADGTESVVKADGRKASSSAKVVAEVPTATECAIGDASATCDVVGRMCKTCDGAVSMNGTVDCDGCVVEEAETVRGDGQVKDDLKSTGDGKPAENTSNGTIAQNTSNFIATATTSPSAIAVNIPPPKAPAGTADSPITLEDETVTTVSKQEENVDDKPQPQQLPSLPSIMPPTSAATYPGAQGKRGYIVKAQGGICWIMVDGVFREITSMTPLFMQG